MTALVETYYWQLALFFAALIVLFLVAVPMIRLKSEYIKHAAQNTNKFARLSLEIARQENTPLIVINILELMMRRLTDKWYPWKLLACTLSGHLRDTAIGELEIGAELGDALTDVDPKIMDLFQRAVSVFAFTMTYRSTLIGFLLRRFVLFIVSDPSGITRTDEQLTLKKNQHYVLALLPPPLGFDVFEEPDSIVESSSKLDMSYAAAGALPCVLQKDLELIIENSHNDRVN